jgi:hypothetical protein
VEKYTVLSYVYALLLRSLAVIGAVSVLSWLLGVVR